MTEGTTTPKLFNTPIEIAMRCLVLLNGMNGESLDIEKLMYLDYLSLNTGDINGPTSLHAPIPNRVAQVYAKRELMRKGLAILISKELAEFHPSTDGFSYSITKAGILFLEYFQTKYFFEYVQRTDWTLKRFKGFSTSELNSFITLRIQNWGGEFLSEDQMSPIL